MFIFFNTKIWHVVSHQLQLMQTVMQQHQSLMCGYMFPITFHDDHRRTTSSPSPMRNLARIEFHKSFFSESCREISDAYTHALKENTQIKTQVTEKLELIPYTYTDYLAIRSGYICINRDLAIRSKPDDN